MDQRFSSEVILSMSFEDCHVIKHKFTQEKDIGEFYFYSETVTPKLNEFEFGDPETIYYRDVDGTHYKTTNGLLKDEQ